MTRSIRTIALDDGCVATSKQLMESPGLRAPSSYEPAATTFYCPRACVPIDSWRDISSEIEYRPWCDDADPLAKVGWFSLAPGLQTSVAAVMARYGHRDRQWVVDSGVLDPTVDAVRAYLRARFCAVGDVIAFKTGFNSPGLFTVTVNRSDGQLTGLHYDSWFGNTLQDRSINRHRIALNLGPVARWFLYAPVALAEVAAALARMRGDDYLSDKVPIGDVGRLLLGMGAPIHCLRLDPGQGYIAATDAIAHDATTWWADKTSFNLQLLGEFGWLSNNTQ